MGVCLLSNISVLMWKVGIFFCFFGLLIHLPYKNIVIVNLISMTVFDFFRIMLASHCINIWIITQRFTICIRPRLSMVWRRIQYMFLRTCMCTSCLCVCLFSVYCSWAWLIDSSSDVAQPGHMTQQMAEEHKETADGSECACQHVNESESTLAIKSPSYIQKYNNNGK